MRAGVRVIRFRVTARVRARVRARVSHPLAYVELALVYTQWIFHVPA